MLNKFQNGRNTLCHVVVDADLLYTALGKNRFVICCQEMGIFTNKKILESRGFNYDEMK